MNKFLKEIFEQPAAIEKVLAYYTGTDGRQSLEKVKSVLGKGEIAQIIFTGMGSSYFVSHAAATLFNALKINSHVVNASELLHYNLSLLERKTLLVCTSQSGESFEILEILKQLPATVCCVGITNEEESTLARKADIALFCKSGKEEMTSTKTYVSTTLVAFILGWYLAGKWDDTKIERLELLAQKFKTALTDYEQWVNPVLDFLGDLNTLQIIARGPAFSTASQGALMFKEAVKIPATGILGGEFRHGPMEMVGEGFKAMLIAGRGKTLDQSLKMAEDIARFGGKVLLITNAEIKFSIPQVQICYVDEPDEYLFSVQGIIPVQLFIDAYAKRRGLEAGSFSRGAKVTAIE
ncbi:MAG: SIS domain-containing protein [Cyclobacteriaceae bacterium]|nr:SIS domain-containing protein [Cyclobacteriaceae bacterium]